MRLLSAEKVTFGTTLSVLLAVATAAACREPAAVTCEGDALFGRPNGNTGLSADRCTPLCTCGGDIWMAPPLASDGLPDKRLIDPPAAPAANPYDEPSPPPVSATSVCAVRFEADGYRLETFDSASVAEVRGGIVTHAGACGLCSSLADLAVYVRYGDLTEPVRQCGLDHLFSTSEEHLACLTSLGFTEPCAWIWYYNTINTRQQCADECFAAIDAPYHDEDGDLNACLKCDERKSGPVFKAVAGRTRRNSGLPTAICRPCDTVLRLDHDYSP